MRHIPPRNYHEFLDVPVYGTLKVSPSSSKRLNQLEALDFAKEQKGWLQSAGQALAIQLAFYETDQTRSAYELWNKSHHEQRTSTMSVKIKNDGSFGVQVKYVVFFAELEDNNQSDSLVADGLAENNCGRPLIKPINHPVVRDLIARARASGRTVPALADRTITLSSNEKYSELSHETHPRVVALFGNQKLPALQADYFNRRFADGALIWDRPGQRLHLHDTPVEKLEALLKDGKSALVQCVGLNMANIANISAEEGFDSRSLNAPGYARAVLN